MKLSDVEIGGVYRYTYSGPPTSPLNKRGPWLVGAALDFEGGGKIAMSAPMNGLPVMRSRPVAGAMLATAPVVDLVHVTRLDGRLCHISEWDTWIGRYKGIEADEAARREDRRVQERRAVIVLVAALMRLSYPVGKGPWDRSTPWAQFVDDVRRREPPVLFATSQAYAMLAGLDMNALGEVVDTEYLDRAAAWYDAPIS